LALRGKTRRCVSAGGDTARVIGKRRGPGRAAEPSGGLPRGLALLVAGAFFMEILDGTVIAPAAPLIAADLGIRAVDVNVAISGYLVTVAVLIPISGWAAERFGTRRVFAVAIALFTLASAGCALAPDLTTLTATRVVQGVGGALMVPVGRLAVLRATAKADLIRAIAYLTWPALLAPVLAPAIGGVLSEYASWRWIFVINVPLGIAGLLLVRRLVPDLRADGPPPRLDRRGFVLVAAGIAALMVAVESVGGGAIEVPFVAGGAVLAAALLTVAVVHLLRASAPLLDLRILRITSFRVTAAGGSVYRMVIVAIPFLLPLMFQLGFGWNAAQAGLVLIALFAGNVGIKPVTTPLMRRLGLRTVLLGAIPAGLVCLLGMAALTPTTPLPLLIALLAISGVFRSIGFSAYNSLAFADVEPAHMTPANTLMTTVQELGAGLGVAVGALLLRLGGPVAAATGLPDDATSPYRVAFVLLAVLLLLPLAQVIGLPRSAGAAVTGRG
jgi:EmrB/QacA subfamily drug resistance transporter